MQNWFLIHWLSLCLPLLGQAYGPTAEKPPELPREFRAAWVATIYNIDWPSKSSLPAATQQAEARAILDRLASLNMNAVILQVRPHADALYESTLEPWSLWLTGKMGKDPGYDPLDYWIKQAHARGIELHAWFNPFRALSNVSHSVCANHVSRTKPHLIKRYGNLLLCDPSHPETRSHALEVILDVVRRYDIDGVHLDDYFYPYPSGKLRFDDGQTPAQRRTFVDTFVSQLYAGVKKEKPWVRVGISPFGIWRPGIPAGIEAGVDSYEHLAGDSRKWLEQGWVDYLAPQLYWRIEPRKQSFPVLLEWWRGQGSRPVWPGIATTRIQSKEDPGRTAAEIVNQIALSRKIGRNWTGHLHWSVKGIMTNQGGIATELSKVYAQPAAVPPMPWISRSAPASPDFAASVQGTTTSILWTPVSGVSKIAIQAGADGKWHTAAILPAETGAYSISKAETLAVSAIDRFGNVSPPKVLSIKLKSEPPP